MRPIAGYRNTPATQSGSSYQQQPQARQSTYGQPATTPSSSTVPSSSFTSSSTTAPLARPHLAPSRPTIDAYQSQQPPPPPPLSPSPQPHSTQGSTPQSYQSSVPPPPGPSGQAPPRPSISHGGPQHHAPSLKVAPQGTGPQHPAPPATPLRQPMTSQNSFPQQSLNVTATTNNTPQDSDLNKRIASLQADLLAERGEKDKLMQDNTILHTQNVLLKQEVERLSLHREELERQALYERKQHLEYEAVIDRMGLKQHVQPNLRRTSSSMGEPPPPPPPQQRIPQQQQQQLHNGNTQKSFPTTPTSLDLRTHRSTNTNYQSDSYSDGSTIKSPSQSNHASAATTMNYLDEKPPSLAMNTFSPPTPTTTQSGQNPHDTRRAILNNSRVDQKQALSPLEDDWTFDNNSGGGFLGQDQMNNIIQQTLEQWSVEFGFSKDIRDFMLLEIADIVESSPSEQLMKRGLERYHYELVTSPYQLSRKVGSGGFGSVYQGVEKATGMPVAIKVISLEDTEDDVMVITREITALVQGHSCPQLIRYYGSDVKSTKLWIVMEYVNGGSLLDHIKIESLGEKYIAIVAREVLLGLQYLNLEGKIHRDIKAANILIGTEGSVKLADFGASRALNDTMSKCNTFVGSPYWMSPDVITQHDYDGKADVWSLGITCIELAQGKPPHTNVNPMAVLQVIIRDPPPQLHGNFSKDFKDFVSMCLIKDPTDRASVTDLLKTKFIKNAKKTKIVAELFGGEEQ